MRVAEVDEFCRIDEVRRAARMDVNGRAEFREAPCGAGMIEMDVTEKHVPDVSGRETSSAESFSHVRERRLRPGVEEDESIVSLDRRRRDNARPAELPCVENVDHHCPQVLTETTLWESPELGVQRPDVRRFGQPICQVLGKKSWVMAQQFC